MTRDELIKLAVECGWHLTTGGYLHRGLVDIYPGDDPDPDRWQAGSDHLTGTTVNLWDERVGFPAKHIGYCLLEELRTRRRPWIIGPFSGKFFSLKSMRVWK